MAPFGGQLLHHITVVDDLLADVDRRAERLQRNANDVDGAHHAGAKASRLQQKKGLGFRLSHEFLVVCTDINPHIPTDTLL